MASQVPPNMVHWYGHSSGKTTSAVITMLLLFGAVEISCSYSFAEFVMERIFQYSVSSSSVPERSERRRTKWAGITHFPQISSDVCRLTQACVANTLPLTCGSPARPQELLRRRFEVWLKETGKQREINSLAACKERTSRYEKYKQMAAAAASGGGGGERETTDTS